METLTSSLVGFAGWLLRTSFQASIVVALVLVAQWLFRKKLSPRWRYALWSVVLIRLLLPVSPESRFSIFNLAQATFFAPRTQASEAAIREPVAPASPSFVPLATSASSVPSDEPKSASAHENEKNLTRPSATLSPSDGERDGVRGLAPRSTLRPLYAWLSVLWLAGALFLASRIILFPLRLNAQLARHETPTGPAVFEILEQAKRLMRITKVLPIVQSRAVKSPALMGFIRPWLLLPDGMVEGFTPQELRLVFLHELAHLKRRDIAVNWLMTVLQILHWFNPLVWFAFGRMRADRELACDELALSFAQADEHKSYGQAIIKLLEGFTRPATVPSLVGILEDKQQMKRRITMIAQFKKTTGWPVAALALVTLLGCVSLTDSKKQNTRASNRPGVDAGVTAVTGGVAGQPVVRLVASDKIDRWVAFGDSWVSPNGKYLNYVNWGHGNLAFYNIETGELRDLTTEGTWNPPDQFTWGGVWSPDSTQIAFLWRKGDGGELRMVHRDGGKSRLLVPAHLWPQGWAKDGKHIVALGPYRQLTPDSMQKPEGIVLVEVSTGRTNMVKRFPDAYNPKGVSFSPDGKHLAYSYPRMKEGLTNALQGDIRIMNIDGSDDRSLIEHPANDVNPQWMPDGKHLLFVSDRSGNVGIWAVPISPGQLAGEPRIVRDQVGGGHFGITDDGSVHYFTGSPSFNVHVAEANFDEGKIGTPKRVSLRYEGKNRNPRWSSDGSKLGYISWRDPAVLVFQDVATGKEEDVKTEWGNFSQGGDRPVWAPDLGRLVGQGRSPNKSGASLFQVDVKSGRRSLLEDVGMSHIGFSVFAPDGKYLINTRTTGTPGDPANGVFELNLATKQARLISREFSGYNEPLTISPDGSRLAKCRTPYPAKAGDTIKLLMASRTDGAIKTVAEFPIADKDKGKVTLTTGYRIIAG